MSESLFHAPGPLKSTDPPSQEVTFYLKQDENLEPVEESKVTKDALEDEVLEAVREAKNEPRKDEPRKERKPAITKTLVQRLRRRDRHFNKTCAQCGRRVPLIQIQGGKGEICDKCRG